MPTGIYIRTEEHGRRISAGQTGNFIMQVNGEKGARVRWMGHVKKTKENKSNRSFDKVVQLQKKRFRNQRYKASKRNAQGSHTFEEWQLLKETYQYICLCCKKQEPEITLSEDHIIPLSMGGNDSIENIQPLCVSCNTRKHARVIDYRSSDKSTYQFLS